MVFFVTENRNLTVFITKCYYLNFISIAKLVSSTNYMLYASILQNSRIHRQV